MEVLNYEKNKLFLGLDVHKKSWELRIATEHSIQKRIHISDPSPEFIVKYLIKHYPGWDYQCVYEAGFSGFWIQEELQKAGISTIVVHAADVPTTDKEKRFKNDKNDGKKLAMGLRSGQLKGIYIPSKEMQRDRSLVRQRYQFASDERRYKNRIKSHLYFYGIDLGEDQTNQYWSKRYLNELRELSKETKDLVLTSYIDKLEAERSFVLLAARRLRQLSKEARYQTKSSLLMSIPGVGLLTAMVFLTEIGPIERFGSDDELKSYIGLVPGIHSSGESSHTGKLSKRGNKQVRTSLILSAWIAIRNDSALANHYENYRKRGLPGNKAIIKIAAKLALIMKAVLRDNKKYERERIIVNE